jgi:hypothetical protein
MSILIDQADLDLSDIDAELRPASLMRVAIDDEVIADYAEIFEELPRVEVMLDFRSKTHWLVDGRQRVLAARSLGRTTIPASIKKGTYQEALRSALRANLSHGVRLTRADKRRKVVEALTEFPDESNRGIAEMCCVSHTFVNNIREEFESGGNPIASPEDDVIDDFDDDDDLDTPDARNRVETFPHGAVPPTGGSTSAAGFDPCAAAAQHRQRAAAAVAGFESPPFDTDLAWSKAEEMVLAIRGDWHKELRSEFDRRLQALATRLQQQ